MVQSPWEWVWTHNACSSTSGNNAASKIGRDQHALYKAGLDDGDLYRKEFRIPGTKLKVDFIDFENGIVFELKPNNLRARRRGEMQANTYIKAIREHMKDFAHIDWKAVVETY